MFPSFTVLLEGSAEKSGEDLLTLRLPVFLSDPQPGRKSSALPCRLASRKRHALRMEQVDGTELHHRAGRSILSATFFRFGCYSI